MKKRFLILIVLFITIMTRCITPSRTITPVDFSKYDKEFKPGMTQADVNAEGQKEDAEVEANSIGRKIPKVIIKRPDGTEKELSGMIHNKTLIVLSDVHCGWGMAGLEEDLPKASKKLKENHIDLPIICLVIKDSSDYKDPELFNDALKRLKVFYSQIFIIDQKESNKLNVYANPTRLLINKKKILKYMGTGVSTANDLFEELNRIMEIK